MRTDSTPDKHIDERSKTVTEPDWEVLKEELLKDANISWSDYMEYERDSYTVPPSQRCRYISVKNELARQGQAYQRELVQDVSEEDHKNYLLEWKKVWNRTYIYTKGRPKYEFDCYSFSYGTLLSLTEPQPQPQP
jgi:hypothetical protein